MIDLFKCACGLSFTTRDEVRKHIKSCTDVQEIILKKELICSTCHESTQLLISNNNNKVCPSCVLLYEQPILIFGTPVINRMRQKRYEVDFKQQSELLLRSLNFNNLSDLGISVVLIQPSQEKTYLPFRCKKKGELLFLFNVKRPYSRHYEAFKYAITHEIFHNYISRILRLGITDALTIPFSAIENSVRFFAEDIQLIKVAIKNHVKPLISNELRKANIYYENLPAIPDSKWNTLDAHVKFNAMFSITFVYATHLLLYDKLVDSHYKHQTKRNIRFVHSHYDKRGFSDLMKSILKIYNDEIAETNEEKKSMFNKLLLSSNEWVKNQNLRLS